MVIADDGTADARTVAELIGVTARRVRQLVREGVLPKVSRGSYPVAGCIQAYIGYWQKRAEPSENGHPEYKESRARKMAFDAELKALELERKRGSLVPVDVVEEQVRDALEPVDIGLRTAHSRLSPSVAAELGIAEGEAVHLIRRLTDELRAHLVRVLEGEEPLPDDFPCLSILEREGIETLTELREVEDLTEIPGIGPARAKEIEEAMA